MPRMFTPSGQPSATDRASIEGLEQVMQHLPLGLVVEIVEARYRDRRNRFFLQVLGGVLTLIVAGTTIMFQVYTRMVETEQTEIEQQLQLQQEREQNRVRAEYGAELERTRTRLQFARTLQSFDAGNIDDTLEIGQPIRVQLEPGERKQYAINITDTGRYSITASDPQRTEMDRVLATAPAFTPVMYLYQLGSGIVNPLEVSTTRSMFFDYSDGTYYLEVEELLRDPGEFTLIVGGLSLSDTCPAGC